MRSQQQTRKLKGKKCKEKLPKTKGQPKFSFPRESSCRQHAAMPLSGSDPGLQPGRESFDCIAEQYSTVFPKTAQNEAKIHKTYPSTTARRGNFFNSCRQRKCRTWMRFSKARKTQNNSSFQDKTCSSFGTVELVICYKNICIGRTRPSEAILELLSYHLH